MLSIGLCSESNTALEQLQETLQQFLNTTTLTITIHVFHYLAEVEATTDVALDILLLDTDTHLASFHDSAQTLRQVNPNCAIILLGRDSENAVFGYRINASEYLLKPVEPEDLMTALTRIIKQNFAPPLDSVKVKVSGIWVPLPLSKILFVESSSHNVLFHMVDGSEFRMLASLRDYTCALELNKNFFRCHQSYIVNLNYVVAISQTEFTMSNEEVVAISRPFKQAAKSYYVNYCFERNLREIE